MEVRCCGCGRWTRRPKNRCLLDSMGVLKKTIIRVGVSYERSRRSVLLARWRRFSVCVKIIVVTWLDDICGSGGTAIRW